MSRGFIVCLSDCVHYVVMSLVSPPHMKTYDIPLVRTYTEKKKCVHFKLEKKGIYRKVKGSIKPVRTEMRLTLRLRLSPSTRPLRCHNVKMYIPVQIEIEADIKFGQD